MINPVNVILWTFRRNEHDVVNLYNSLSPVMQLATGGNMLNFGYWDGTTEDPIAAQCRMCSVIGDIAELQFANKIIDVGSGLGAPAELWKSKYGLVDISCVNINYEQLQYASKLAWSQVSTPSPTSSPYLSFQERDRMSLVNATSTSLPFSDQSADRILALESAQHFKPLNKFFKESRRILKPRGSLIIGMPVTTIKAGLLKAFFELGILYLTWSSEHYEVGYVESAIENNGFKIECISHIGHAVYEPLADYYILNRIALRKKILGRYPPIVETILYKSLLKMKDVSEKGIIDYVVIKAAL